MSIHSDKTVRSYSITSVDRDLITNKDCEKIVNSLQLNYIGIVNFVVVPTDEIRTFFSKYGELIITVNQREKMDKIYFLIQNWGRKRGNFILWDKNKGGESVEYFFHKIFLQDVKALNSTLNIDVFLKCFLFKGSFAVFEDVMQYKFGSTKHFDIFHVMCAFDALSVIHTASILLTHKYGVPITKLYNNYLKEPIFFREKGTHFQIIGAVLDALYLFMKRVKVKKAPSELKLNLYYQEFLSLINDPSPYRRVVCHGNPYTKTLFFKYEDRQASHCKLINFQLLRYAPPAFDVTFLLTFSMDEDVRLESYETLVLHYYQMLKNKLNENGLDVTQILPFYEFEETCKIFNKATKFLLIMFQIFSLAIEPKLELVLGDNGFIKEYTSQCLMMHTDIVIKKLELLDELLKTKYIIIPIEDMYQIAQKYLSTKDFQFGSHELILIEKYDVFCMYNYYNFFMELSIDTVSRHFKGLVKALCLDKNRRTMIINTGRPLKEYLFYKTFIAIVEMEEIFLLDDLVNICFLSRANDVMVFQDIVDIYEYPNIREDLNINTVKFIIDNMAKLHATFYIYEERMTNKLKRVYRLSEDYKHEMRESFFNEAELNKIYLQSFVNGLMDQFDYFSEDLGSMDMAYFKQRVMEYCNFTPYLVTPSKKCRNTIIHGSLWSENIVLKKENSKLVDCKFLNWDTFRYNAPGQELMGFLYLNTSRKFREKHFSELADHYYSCLTKYMVQHGIMVEDVMSFSDFVTNCEDNVAYGIIISAYILHLGLMTKQQLDEFYNTPGVADRFFTVTRGDRIRLLCCGDIIYKERQREIVLDFLHMFRTMA